MTPEQQYFHSRIDELARRLESAERRFDMLSPAALQSFPPVPDPVREWTGSEATALRKALRMTERKFATVLSVSLRTVANWASSPAMVPRAAAQDMLDKLLADASPAARAKFDLVRLTR